MVHGPLRKRGLFVTKIGGIESSVDLKIVKKKDIQIPIDLIDDMEPKCTTKE